MTDGALRSQVRTFGWSLLFIFLLSSIASEVAAQESWPSDAEWIVARDRDWNPLGDPVEGFQSGIEFIPDPATATSAFLYSTSTSIFFRLVLEGDPSKKTDDPKFLAYAWYVSIDVDNDNYPDWSIVLEGFSTDRLATWYNATGGINNIPKVMNWSRTTPKPSGYAKVTLPNGSNGMAYLDIQAPYSAFNNPSYAKTVTASTAIRFFFTTTTTAQLTNIKDILSPTGLVDINQILSNSMTIQLDEPDAYGFVVDTREPVSTVSTSGGCWLRNETVLVNGYGWPTSASPYYSATGYAMRIEDPAEQIVWSGQMTTNSTGDITNLGTFTIPITSPAGIYTINVQNPLDGSTWTEYDEFTVRTPEPGIELISSVPSATSGETISYTLTVENVGDTTGTITSIIDTLPGHFTYVNGSSSGLTSTDPVINSGCNSLTWTGNWTLPEAGPLVLTFNVVVSGGGSNYSRASVGGSDFTTIITGATAPVSIVGPFMACYKRANVDSIDNHGSIIYTISLHNEGTADGHVTTITDSIPSSFTFQAGTVAGDLAVNPVASDNELSWSGNWTVAPADSFVFSYTVQAGAIRGTFYNIYYASGSDFYTTSSGYRAGVKVLAPLLQISIVVDKSNALPTDTLNYITTYQNIGDSKACTILIIETIPACTQFIPGSATGSGVDIYYSHDGGASFDSSDELPVSHIKYQRLTDLEPGASEIHTYAVRID